MTEEEVNTALQIMPNQFLEELHKLLSVAKNYKLIDSQLEKASINFEMNGFQLPIESRLDLMLLKEKLIDRCASASATHSF